MYWRFYAPENTHYNLRKLCACVTQSYCFSSPIWTFLAPVIVLFDHQLHTHCFMISERVVKKYFKSKLTVQFLVGLEIKTVRTVLKLCGIHRLLVIFRANLITYNFQTFFLPQGISLKIIHEHSFHLFKMIFNLGLDY